MSGRLDGKVAVITGAGQGIGAGLARRFGREGARIVVAEMNPETGARTVEEVQESGGDAVFVATDVSVKAQAEGAVQAAIDQWGRIDVLVNNAVHTGPGSMLSFEDTTIEMVETKLAANVVSQLILIKAVLPHMLERGDGTIINVTSAVAYQDPTAPPGEGGWGSAYAMSKGAFHRIAPNLSVEYPSLRFYNVQPGYVVTERMEVNAKELGLEGKYPGAPPSVPAAVIAWAATSPDAVELNGTCLEAQQVAKRRNLHEKWW
jgi:NAD(P)-dependent dehydrogenase (short-subunit alcohol dehydrogenase family)